MFYWFRNDMYFSIGAVTVRLTMLIWSIGKEWLSLGIKQAQFSSLLQYLYFTDPYGFHPKTATSSFSPLTPTAQEGLHPFHQWYIWLPGI